MAYNFTVDLSGKLLKASESVTDFKKRYSGLIIWTSYLQHIRDYDLSIETVYISSIKDETLGWDIPKYIFLNNEEDLLYLKLKFLT